jgi:AcrR family transcriptional regulator
MRESGVGRATLYRHWPSLDDLWPELISETADTVMPEPTGDLRADLTGALRVVRDHVDTRVGRVQLLAMMERAQWDEQAAKLLRLTEEHSPIRRILAQAIASGSIDDSLDVDLAVALLTGPVLQRMMFGGRADNELLDAVVDAYLGGPSGPGAASSVT